MEEKEGSQEGDGREREGRITKSPNPRKAESPKGILSKISRMWEENASV